MPDRPPRMCAKCRATFTGPRCPCRKPWEGSRRAGKSTRAYRRYRDDYLANNPICEAPGCPLLAQVADHITPVSKGGHMFGPLQSLCHTHHKAKTQAEAREGRGLA